MTSSGQESMNEAIWPGIIHEIINGNVYVIDTKLFVVPL